MMNNKINGLVAIAFLFAMGCGQAAKSGTAGDASPQSPDASLVDGAVVPPTDAGAVIDAGPVDALFDPNRTDPHSCGVYGHDCLGDACKNGYCVPERLDYGRVYGSITNMGDYWTDETMIYYSGVGIKNDTRMSLVASPLINTGNDVTFNHWSSNLNPIRQIGVAPNGLYFSETDPVTMNTVILMTSMTSVAPSQGPVAVLPSSPVHSFSQSSVLVIGDYAYYTVDIAGFGPRIYKSLMSSPYSNLYSNSLAVVPATGGQISQMVTDGVNLYWIGANGMMKAPAAGATTPSVLFNNARKYISIDPSGQVLYSDNDFGQVISVSTGGTVQTLSPLPYAHSGGIAADSLYVYACDGDFVHGIGKTDSRVVPSFFIQNVTDQNGLSWKERTLDVKVVGDYLYVKTLARLTYANNDTRPTDPSLIKSDENRLYRVARFKN